MIDHPRPFKEHDRGESVIAAVRIVGVVGGLALVLGGMSAPALASAGMTPMAKSTIKAVTKDTSLAQPSSCYGGLQSRSDRRWAAFWGKLPDDRCQVGEGWWVVHKTKQGWIQLRIGGSSIPCSALKQSLREAGGSHQVFKDFKAEGFCFAD